MKQITVGILLLVAVSAHAEERRFAASDIAGVKLRHSGKIVVQNDGKAITAFHFLGDFRQALFSLKSIPATHRTFGGAVFNSNAAVPAGVPPYLAQLIDEASKSAGVDPRLVTAVVGRESAFNPAAVSPVGAQGLMQLMPQTARYLGITDPFDPRQNVFAGAKYLRKLLDTFSGDIDLTLAAYNAGPGAVARYRGVPPYRETIAYVQNVRARYEKSLQ
jgi:soluble lytic murein transglycosylase-like protein